MCLERAAKRTMGQRRNMMVGRVKASQKPTYWIVRGSSMETIREIIDSKFGEWNEPPS